MDVHTCGKCLKVDKKKRISETLQRLASNSRIFDVHGSVHSKCILSITNKMQRYTVDLFCKMLFMFQAVPPPIIRSSKTIHTASGIC
jgi:hypothetical protein